MTETAFYCVADERYFLGAVGLINSLRLVGHNEPIVVCDCGLDSSQRELLASEVSFVEGPTGPAPQVLKAVAPRAVPAEVAVLIDVDMVVVRRLDELIATAAEGRVVAGSAELQRFVPEWGELLGLGEVRPTPYVSTGLVVAGGRLGRVLIELVDERRDAVDFERSYWRHNDQDYALVHADQDLINAVLAARAEDSEIVVLDPRLSPSPPFAGLEIRDARTLRCSFADGLEPYVVHHWLAKPWLERTHHGVYSQLLQRLLIGHDLAIRVPADRIPHRFRAGALAAAERRAINARERLRWHVTEPLRRGVSR